MQAVVLDPDPGAGPPGGGRGERARTGTGIKVETIYGGDSMDRQLEGLRAGAQVVVGTPGRVLDHLRRRTLRFDP